MLYIAPVVLSKIRKIIVICEGFVITETYEAYNFILESMFKMCSLQSEVNIYAIFSDEFMTKIILDSIGTQNNFIFTTIFIWKGISKNLEFGSGKYLSYLLIWLWGQIVKIFECLYHQAVSKYDDSIHYVSILLIYIEKTLVGFIYKWSSTRWF